MPSFSEKNPTSNPIQPIQETGPSIKVLVWNNPNYVVADFHQSIEEVRNENRATATKQIRQHIPEGYITDFENNWLSDNYIEYEINAILHKIIQFWVELFIINTNNNITKTELVKFYTTFWKDIHTKIDVEQYLYNYFSMYNYNQQYKITKTDNKLDTEYRTNYKPYRRLVSLLKHYIVTHHIRTQHHNYNSEQSQVDMARYATDAWYRYVISHGGTRPTRPHRKRTPSKKRTPYKTLHKRRVRSFRRRRTTTRKH